MPFHSAVCVLPALERQAEFLERLSDRTALTAVFGLDLAGHIQWCGDAAEPLYGYRASECVGQHAALLWQNKNEPALALERALLSGKWEGHALHATRDGSALFTHVTLLLRRDHSGRARDLIALCRDLSAQRRIEEDLLTSRAARAPLLDTSVALLLLADASGELLRASARAQRLLLPGITRLNALFAERDVVDTLLTETRRSEGLEDVELSLLQPGAGSLALRCDTVAVRGRHRGESSVLLALRPLAARDVAAPRSMLRSSTRLRACEAVEAVAPLGNEDELCA